MDTYFGVIPKPDTPIPRVTTKEPARTAAQTLREYDAKPPLPALAVTYLGPSATSDEAPAWEIAQHVMDLCWRLLQAALCVLAVVLAVIMIVATIRLVLSYEDSRKQRAARSR